jgi:uncharacterized protein (TIGR00255 family)
MTGFGAATGRVGTQQITVELRTVNHRFLNPNIKLPASLSRWEGEVRDVLRRGIARGHVTLVARVERDARAALTIDEAKFASYVAQLKGLQERHGLADTLDVAAVLRMPDVLAGDDGAESDAGTAAELVAVVQEALTALTRMREAEGGRLAELLEARITTVEQALDRIAARAPERLVGERERLMRNVRELADGVDLDPMRLAQEIAILADRLDVAEEIDRFRSHITAFRNTLRGAGSKSEAGEQVGKRLGFLLQEMLREANTTGSKARDAIMLHDVVAVKEELERLAEQVENVE